MCVLTSNQTNKHFIIRAFLFIPPSRIQERIYIGQCSTVANNKLLWENIWKVYKQSNRNSKWRFIPMRVLSYTIYHWWFLSFSLSRLRLPSPLFWRFLLHPLSYYLVGSPTPLTRFKVTTSGFKLNKYYNYSKTDSSIMFKLLLYSFGKKKLSA